MSANVQPQPVKSTHWMRWIGICAILSIAGFLIGFIPMWLQVRQSSSSLSAAEHELSMSRTQNALASAAIDARKGNYETARVAASDFFTALRTETDKGDSSTFSPAQREGMQPLLTQRDEIITLLARGDAASADKLTALYGEYLKLVSP